MPTLDEGTYFGRLVEIGTDKLANEKKTEYIFTTWEVTHRADGKEWEAIDPVRRDVRWWCTEKAEPFTIERLQEIGFNGNFDRPEFNADPHPERDGRQLICKHDTRGDRLYENWDLDGERQQRERQPWDADRTRLFAARYRQQVESSKQPAGQPGAPAAAPAASATPDNSPVRDDEVPGGPKTDGNPPGDVSEDEIPF